MAATQLPALDEAGFAAACERVRETGELRLGAVSVSSDQVHALVDQAPRDSVDPDVRRIAAIDLHHTTVVGDVHLQHVVCGALSFFSATFVHELRLTDVTVSGRASIYETTFALSMWGARFEGDASFDRTTFERAANFETATFAATVVFEETRFMGRTVLGATFLGRASITSSTFEEYVVVHKARFEGTVTVSKTTFEADAFFGHTWFCRDARFDEVTFERDAVFGATQFGQDASFSGTHFQHTATFELAVVHGRALFGDVKFDGAASFAAATFLDGASFDTATFAGDAGFGATTFAEQASFIAATFEQARQLGPMLASSVDLRGAVFLQPIRIELSAHRLLLERALFQRGGDLFLRWAHVALDGASFSGPSLLAGLPRVVPAEDDVPTLLGREQPYGEDGWRCWLDGAPAGTHPHVVSLRNATVSQLTLSGVDLSACLFAGAHGLDALRLERASFARTPSRWRARLRQPRWTRRQTIAEEHEWRSRHGHGPGWHERPTQAPTWLSRPPQPIAGEQVAAIYRDLRKGREDDKDEPGAADFYYGEMEMRRHAGRRRRPGEPLAPAPEPLSTRIVMLLYWLVSGYGLRASRALAALVLTVALLALPLDLWGFRPDRAYGRALLFAAQSSVSLLHAPNVKLSASGEVVQLALRLVGPVLFGLAALSLRGRVKR